MSSDKYIELSVLSDSNSLFDENDAHYIIPLYQRAYAWGEKEIEQLIEDIDDVDLSIVNTKYYLGSLIVYKRHDGKFEVIDGQQRMTTLFLLLNAISEDKIDETLEFECRDKSNYTLKNLKRLQELEKDKEQQIVDGINIIEKKIASLDSKNDFMEKLKRVCLYRIEVPEHTDLNRYFEIMNTRGEQLEQQDILKSDLMSYIKDPIEQSLFAEIWDACSDMTGYVQMHFSVSKKKDNRNSRETLFGNKWECFPTDANISKLKDLQYVEDSGCVQINDIIADSFKVSSEDGLNESNERVRFESIIDFKYFLLHVLRIYVSVAQIRPGKSDTRLIEDMLDDKKLRNSFEYVLDVGLKDGKPLDRNEFSLGFIKCLLQVRFLFDKYIIKREYANESEDGEWSLKELRLSKSDVSSYYANTPLSRSREWERTYEHRNRNNLMIQSCLRVSYTSPKVMHWLTDILNWLYEDNQKNLEQLDQLLIVTKDIARKAVKELFLDQGKFDMGVDTPHIVFNYLDYLLWEREKENVFNFEFRNSVEHWYPQHPSEGTISVWSHDDGLNAFGNLCIIQRSINSRFSNMSPEAKKSTYKEMIERGSLKLRLMAKATTDSTAWRNGGYKDHGEEMIRILQHDCAPELCSTDTGSV